MTLEISAKALRLSQQTAIQPQIVLKIDDIPLCFGAIDVEKLVRYGNEEGTAYGDGGIVYGGTIADKNSRPWIQLGGTTTRFRQQIEPTKEGDTSIQQVNIKIIDKNEELTKTFAPGEVVDDILSKRAQVYVMFKGGAFPEDAIRLMSGVITNSEYGAGWVKLTVAHPEHMKRSKLFVQQTKVLDGAINSSQTTITLDNTDNMVEPASIVRTFVRVNDEIIEYTGISGSDITGCTRGTLTTIADSHDDGDDATTYYELEDRAIPMALKLMLSDPEKEYWIDDEEATRFVKITATQTTDNGVFFPNETLQRDVGFVEGDFLTIEGSGSNDFVDAEITDVFKIDTGTVVVVSGPTLVEETDASATAKFKSKYNVLPIGVQLDPTLVDVERHETFANLFPTAFPIMTIRLHDTIVAKEFINKEIYFVNGLFPVPRDGKASVNYTLPPLVEEESIKLGFNEIKKPENLVIKRSTNFNFFNSIVYKFEEDPVDEGRFLAGEIALSTRSTDRIKTVNKPLTIESKGLRDNADTRVAIKRSARRFLDRYQFAAQEITCEVLFRDGFRIEPADIVIFGDNDLKISDIDRGNRGFEPRLMEVLNKEMDLATGVVKLRLIDSEFGLDARYGVISPSSEIDLDSSKLTASRIPLLKSFSTEENELEKEKWEQYIGEEVEIHNVDFSFAEIVTLEKFDETNSEVMVISPALSSVPAGETFYVDAPKYPETDTDTNTQALWKRLHCFTTFQDTVISGASDTEFDVNNPDKFFVDSLVRVHNVDFSDDSSPDESADDAVVVDITGNTLTVDKSLGFTPGSTHLVELIGFVDEGKPYRAV